VIAANVMSSDVVSLKLEFTVKDAIALFQGYSLHDCPVIDDEGKPIGILKRLKPVC